MNSIPKPKLLKPTAISIIIVTYNEAKNIQKLLKHLLSHKHPAIKEILVVDGGSTDDTPSLADSDGVEVLKSPKKGRAFQMNYGAQRATGNILYFVHADTLPPISYASDILNAIKNGFPIGCFRFQFDSDRFLLKVNSYFTRFDKMWCRGGDQSLFVRREIFDDLNGYTESMQIMEEYDFIKRARINHSFKIIPKPVLVSARKYKKNGYLRVQVANLTIFNMYRFGCSQKFMVTTYNRLLK